MLIYLFLVAGKIRQYVHFLSQAAIKIFFGGHWQLSKSILGKNLSLKEQCNKIFDF
jgi:hypothetical protein